MTSGSRCLRSAAVSNLKHTFNVKHEAVDLAREKTEVKLQGSASRQLRVNLNQIQMKSNQGWQGVTVWTIGHSTRTSDDFIQMLSAHSIKALVDVRSFPSSRRFPHFNQPELTERLRTSGITYYHNAQLGGRRRPSPNSKNTAWQNASFRAYADHMDSADFALGIEALRGVATESSTAIMCAEALWWRCHRGLISDFLKAEGTQVLHILDVNKVEEHPYTSAARIVEGRLSYEGLFAQ